MRISELADQSGVSVPTVKFYLREGILHPGRKITPRLTEYDDSHLHRLRLVRLLREVGDLPIARIKAVVTALDAPRGSVHDVFAAAADALAPPPMPPQPGSEAARADARAAADAIIAGAGWTRVRTSAPDRENLAIVLERLADLTGQPPDHVLSPAHVAAADALSQGEIAYLHGDRESLLAQMVVGQVLVGEALATLRRLGEEHWSSMRFADGQP